MTNETHEKIVQDMTSPAVISTTATIIERALDDDSPLTRGMLTDLVLDQTADSNDLEWLDLGIDDVRDIIDDTLLVRPDLARRLSPR